MIVLVENKYGEAYADSAVVARKFDMKHNKLISVVESVFSDYPDLRGSSNTPQSTEKYFTEERIYHGQRYTAYMMNRAFFSLVAMRFNSQPAREWQRKFNTAFYQLEKQLLLAKNHKHDEQWVLQRTQTKLLRKAETDVIEQFVDYATEQGSRNANNYYSLITTATYKALGLIQYKQLNLRNTLNALQLSWLVTLESLVQASLRKYMSLNVHYKEIYKLVANDIREYAAPLTLLEHS
ncbi:MAG: Rha family transcriptional regulator [Methylotenera sp.]|nr:Rha family transcriptional regulator [Methylotenera sp.]MDP1958906.1 Rha family transcriptional regulator [Methylotenera sp.]MDP3942899.1 Rha family transcriptional regulator [Methylotenera sp.]